MMIRDFPQWSNCKDFLFSNVGVDSIPGQGAKSHMPHSPPPQKKIKHTQKTIL